jgi:hypothetical protein
MQFLGHTGAINHICLGNNSIIYSASDDMSIRAWDIE